MSEFDFSQFPEELRQQLEALKSQGGESWKELERVLIEFQEKARKRIEAFEESEKARLKEQAVADEEFIEGYLEFEYFGFLALVKREFPESTSVPEALRKLVKDSELLIKVVSSWVRIHHRELVMEQMKQKIINDLHSFRHGA